MSEEKATYKPTDKMIRLSGKEYLQVADRIVWFRNDYPEATIETQIVSIDEESGSAIFRARITTGKGGVAEATGDETKKDFPQGWIGKAETKAVGRALGYLGYGTASAGFEEGERVVDAPIAMKRANNAPASPQRAEQVTQPAPVVLTEAQNKALADARDSAEAGVGYEATKAMVLKLKPDATPEQWQEIGRRWNAIRREHYPQSITAATQGE